MHEDAYDLPTALVVKIDTQQRSMLNLECSSDILMCKSEGYCLACRCRLQNRVLSSELGCLTGVQSTHE